MLKLEVLETRNELAGSIFATGAGVGSAPLVQIVDSGTQQEVTSFLAFDSALTGGVKVTLADINGDGTDDYLVGAGSGGGPHVKIFSGRDLSILASFFAFSPAFTGGVSLATVDKIGCSLN